MFLRANLRIEITRLIYKNLKKSANVFNLQSISILISPQRKIINTSFCILEGLFEMNVLVYFQPGE